MNILNNIQNIIPDSRWKSRTNYNNLTICYSGKCNGFQMKIVQSYDNRFDVKVKSNSGSYSAIYRDEGELLNELPVVLNDLDR